MRADAAADRHRRREADLVHAVVDPHRVTRSRSGRTSYWKLDQQRERQEPVRDRRPERPLRCLLRVDVDPLVVAGRLREAVDPLLGDLQPLARAVRRRRVHACESIDVGRNSTRPQRCRSSTGSVELKRCHVLFARAYATRRRARRAGRRRPRRRSSRASASGPSRIVSFVITHLETSLRDGSSNITSSSAFSMIERRPRAPVSRSSALSAISQSASSVKTSSIVVVVEEALVLLDERVLRLLEDLDEVLAQQLVRRRRRPAGGR